MISFTFANTKEANVIIDTYMKINKILIIGVLILSVSFLPCKVVAQSGQKVVKNIILFIGDGMGTSQIYGAMTASDHKLFLETFPFTGFSKTYSFNNYKGKKVKLKSMELSAFMHFYVCFTIFFSRTED